MYAQTGQGILTGSVTDSSGALIPGASVLVRNQNTGFVYNAVTNQDYPLMQALFLMITLSVLVANFVVDILYGVLDPRTRR